MPAGDIYQLNVDAVYGNQSVTNVFHLVQIGSDGSGSGVDAVQNIWSSFFAAQQLVTQVDTVTHFRNRARRIAPTETQTKVESDSGVGGVSEAGLPTNQCAILRFYGSLDGRKGIGHTKMYGIGVGFTHQGRLTTAWRDIVTLYGDQFPKQHTAGSGYKFQMAVMGNDGVARLIQTADPLPRIKTVYSRSAGVGL